MEEETPVWEGKPSQWVNLGAFVVCGLLSLLVVPLFVAAARFLVTYCTCYRLSTERLEIQSGVFSRRIDQIELYRIKDLRSEEPFLMRIAGLGNLVLRSSDTTHPELVLRGIRDFAMLRNQLRGLVEKRRDAKGVRELDI